jgi:hypothetical protein
MHNVLNMIALLFSQQFDSDSQGRTSAQFALHCQPGMLRTEPHYHNSYENKHNACW